MARCPSEPPAYVAFDGDLLAEVPDFTVDMDSADLAEYLGPHRRPPRCDWCFRRGRHEATCITRCWPIVLSFGKHRGHAVADVEPSYLRWLLRSGAELSGELRGEIEQVLTRPKPASGTETEGDAT